MNQSNDKDKQYLDWYYQNFSSISRIQARLAWIILIFGIFSIFLEQNVNDNWILPFINLKIGIELLYILMPFILSIVFWEFMGALRAAYISIENIKFRLENLGYDSEELRLYDIDPNLNFFDLITFNFKKHIKPGEKEQNKKFDFRHLPYALFVLSFLALKFYLFLRYPVNVIVKIYFLILFLIDIIFSAKLIYKRFNFFLFGTEKN